MRGAILSYRTGGHVMGLRAHVAGCGSVRLAVLT